MSENNYTRRKRYSGKYPKTFKEKYKEQNPDKYLETINKVMSKGNTPAGMHRSIMIEEILSFFDIKAGEVGIDLTTGYGGHSKEILDKLNHTGHLYGIDQDPIELPKTNERLQSYSFTEKDFSLHHLNFKDFHKIKDGGFDFILADLGVSSMQIDNPERGFSFREDGPLDLRMNPDVGKPANIRLLELSELEIEHMLIENADEIYAKQIAYEITKAKQQGQFIQTTSDLYKKISIALKHLPKEVYSDELKKAASRTFQALRIEVNSEYEVLFELLDKLPNYLNPGGRVAILSFHSGEDRLVKKAFKHYFNEGVFKSIDGPISPSSEEIYNNPRARSAKLRTAIKA
ncbi:MAG: 16S rRNA (cytosine(1402)-N(4))-methyltransferase RsmH [Bacilli bacterium]